MKVPEMKVLTQYSASDNNLYKKNESFFDPTMVILNYIQCII